MIGSVKSVCWASAVFGSDRVLSTWSPIVVGDTWISQSQSKSSGKSHASYSFNPNLMKQSEALSFFSPTIVGG